MSQHIADLLFLPLYFPKKQTIHAVDFFLRGWKTLSPIAVLCTDEEWLIMLFFPFICSLSRITHTPPSRAQIDTSVGASQG